MRTLTRALYAFWAVLVAGAIVGVASGYAYLQSSLPGDNGRLELAGLQAPVEVIRDRWGIPHIYAQNEEDALFAQGYVHAQDRLWQMELCRRAAHGTLAELLGATALPGDRLARILDFAHTAEAEWAQMGAEERTALEAYARGVNAFLQGAWRLPIEFQLLRVTPEPWRPQDTLAWARLLAWCMDGGWRQELVRARLVQAVGIGRAAELDPALADMAALPADLGYLADLSVPTLLEAGAQVWPWAGMFDGVSLAVGGQAAAGGGAIVAAAPQLPPQMPSPWYEVQLVGGRYDVVGAGFPGLPGVVVGHNRHIAWGLSSSAASGIDLYVERVRPGDPPQAEFEGGWEAVTVRDESIRVRGQAEPERFQVYTGRHGPLVSPMGGAGKQEQLALRWAGDERPAALVHSILAVDRAASWAEFGAALVGWAAPAAVFVYGDELGNVGYVSVGATDGRPSGSGLLPLPGWTGTSQWRGAASASELAKGLRSAGSTLAVAGGAVSAGDKAGEPGLAAHVARLVAGRSRLTLDDVWAALHDERGIAQPFLALLLARPPQGWLQERTLPYLRSWDLRYDAESLGAGIYETFYWRLAHATWDDELGADLVDAYLNACASHRAVMERLATRSDDPWFDDARTPQREGRDDIVARGFADALDWLGRHFGDLPYEWNWGRVHNVTFRHMLGRRWPLKLLVNRGAMRAGGGPDCAKVVAPDYARGMAVAEVPYSIVMDLGADRRAMAMNSTGESGNALSAHYADMVQPWREGRAHPLLYDREAVLQAKEGVLSLVPAP